MNKAFELPDGQIVSINKPRFMAPEALFQPDLIQKESEVLGMHALAYKTVQECDVDIRTDLDSNVILSGV